MNKTTKIIIFSIILIFAIIQKQTKESSFTNSPIYSKPTELPGTTKSKPKVNPNNNNTKSGDVSNIGDIKFAFQPENGFSPYNAYFGKGIYNNNSGNSFKVENSNNTDAVVLLVNAYSGKKIRNEFVRKGATFEMTGVPNGTYYLEWFSGNNWHPNHLVGSNIKGGFQTNSSFTKTRDASDWMKVEGYQIWTVTLYTVAGGDVESESMNANEFFN